MTSAEDKAGCEAASSLISRAGRGEVLNHRSGRILMRRAATCYVHRAFCKARVASPARRRYRSLVAVRQPSASRVNKSAPVVARLRISRKLEDRRALVNLVEHGRIQHLCAGFDGIVDLALVERAAAPWDQIKRRVACRSAPWCQEKPGNTTGMYSMPRRRVSAMSGINRCRA